MNPSVELDSKIPDSPGCKCERCVSACKRVPGWMTPVEAQTAIDAGFADRLMCDWWDSSSGEIEVLCPAVDGHEGIRAPETLNGLDALFYGQSLGRCNFLTGPGLCEIHESGFKPIECRKIRICDHLPKSKMPRSEIVLLWDTDEGRNLIKKWKELV